jgi:transposase-like protein
MVKIMRKKAHSAEFKFRVAIASIKADRTVSELCQEFGIASSQLYKWKKELLDSGPAVFSNGARTNTSNDSDIDKLHATIGRLKVENDFLERVVGRSR